MVLWSRREAPEVREDEYDTFSLSVFEPSSTGRISLPSDASMSVRAGLRVRGSSSSGFPKKPYRLESWDPIDSANVDMDISLLGMPPEADWVLLSPLVFDRGLIRNALMYRLSNEIDRYAPRTEFAEVFVAESGEAVGLDDYAGIYVIVERIERDRDRVDLTKIALTDTAHPRSPEATFSKRTALVLMTADSTAAPVAAF